MESEKRRFQIITTHDGKFNYRYQNMAANDDFWSTGWMSSDTVEEVNDRIAELIVIDHFVPEVVA
jgi:general stress protein 26